MGIWRRIGRIRLLKSQCWCCAGCIAEDAAKSSANDAWIILAAKASRAADFAILACAFFALWAASLAANTFMRLWLDPASPTLCGPTLLPGKLLPCSLAWSTEISSALPCITEITELLSPATLAARISPVKLAEQGSFPLACAEKAVPAPMLSHSSLQPPLPSSVAGSQEPHSSFSCSSALEPRSVRQRELTTGLPDAVLAASVPGAAAFDDG
mmetsp:Transcript_93330/g.171007  ORF Transcript_93330/g.171007 Transcript_93330/m.171007 type:complete len:213 (+) Transcript_93330:166-804(+)